MRRGGRRVQRVGVREPFVLRQQRRVLAGHRGGRLDLGQAEPQRLGLGGPLPLGQRQRLQLLADRPVPREGPPVVRQHGSQLGAAEPVQRIPLPPGLEQLLLIGLPVHGDQVVGQHLEQRHRHRTAAGERPRPAFGRHRAAEHEHGPVLIEVSPGLLDLPGHLRRDQQPPLHGGPRRTGPHARRIGPPAEQQPERRHDHGLPGPGLTGERGESARQIQHRLVDDAEAADADFLKHARQCPPGYGPASP